MKKNKMQSLVSIIIATYNRGPLLGETLDSVMVQSYAHWECVVVDDGSTDYTRELMEFYCKLDKRFKYHQRPTERPKGANTCRNYGFEVSQGKYVQWLDSDDLISYQKIESQVIQLENDENIDLSFSQWTGFCQNLQESNILKEDSRLYSLNTPQKLFNFFGNNEVFFPPHVYLSKRELISKAGGWNEFLQINQDGEFFSRVLLLSTTISFCDRGLAYYRDSFFNNVSAFDTKGKAEDAILSWKLIELQHKIRYKLDVVPYVEGKKRILFYCVRKAGFIEIAQKHPEFFKQELQKWSLEIKKRQSFQRKVNRIVRFIEVKILNQK